MCFGNRASLGVVVWVACGLLACAESAETGGDVAGDDSGVGSETSDVASSDGESMDGSQDTSETPAPSDAVEEPDGVPVEPRAPVSCDDPEDLVYETPEGALDEGVARGAVLRCATRAVWDSETMGGLAGWSESSPDGWGEFTPSFGVRAHAVLYRTQRRGGAAAVSSAHILVPDIANPEALPVVVIAPPAAGLETGAASQLHLAWGVPYGPIYINPYLAPAYASIGYVVVVPDGVGQGTEGVFGFGDLQDTAQTLLDGPAAAGQLLGSSVSLDDVFMVGYREAGAAALVASALAETYGMQGTLRGVVDFFGSARLQPDVGPGLFSAIGELPENAHRAAAAHMELIAYLANSQGEIAVEDIFLGSPSGSWLLNGETGSLRLSSLASGYGEKKDMVFEDVLAPAFTDGLAACVDSAPECSAPYDQVLEYLKGNFIPMAPDGPPALLVAHPATSYPSEWAAAAKPAAMTCLYEALNTAGRAVDLCIDLGDNPDSSPFDYASGLYPITWTNAVLAGEDPEPCPSISNLPPCQ